MKAVPSIIFALLSAIALPVGAATYHVDPATGSISNPGTAASPWSTLEAVFAANKTFAAGDIILLRSGYHGAPEVKGHNSADVIIKADPGAVPKVRRLVVRSGSRWIISGLDISSENISPASYGGTLVDLETSASHVTIRDCRIRFAADTSAWNLGNWQARAGNGVFSRAPNTTLADNELINVGFAITLYVEAVNSLVSGNSVTNFSMDALRGLADSCVFENNTVINSLTSDGNHDDFFQSWSIDAGGNVGRGTVRNVTVRGNIFISSTNAAQPLQNPPQGIGLFDGMFENWVIENNVISTKTYHGIAVLGAINCRIVNNTVTENAITGTSNIQPWIRIYEHKDYTGTGSFPPRSSGNIVRNNICCWGASMPSTAGSISHNIGTTEYGVHFQNFAALDFYPRTASPAIGAGTSTDAPPSDVMGNLRSPVFDVGAFEHLGGARDQGIARLSTERRSDGKTTVVVDGEGIPGETYRIQSSGNLGTWDTPSEQRLVLPKLRWKTTEPADRTSRFYRIVPVAGTP